ncbi:MAG: hypothetical protein L6R37_000120 [Teloschistes peruensis]|nr:MAG: hypothetical protein L6R37_000120 [Teloschistes peruensis]
MGKRKRAIEGVHSDLQRVTETISDGDRALKKTKNAVQRPFTLQIIAGTYERILHGLTATAVNAIDGSNGKDAAIEFADSFLFNAHASSIRCLALSPPSTHDKVTLASGGSDQTINLYHLSAKRSVEDSGKARSAPSLSGRKVVENPKNKELGSLQHHAANVNALQFPTRSKLLSAADDNTIAIARTRDWTILSTIKVPIPKAQGRPSGDTAPPGGPPSGVIDFAIHPSMKLMISLTKGERCMRLWNLVTGRKAGVLNFDKTLLQAAGESRWSRGDGSRVEWNNAGEEFVISFEKGAVVFGLDSKPKGIIKTTPLSKIHQIRYLDTKIRAYPHADILAVSTEDGRVVFFSTISVDGSRPETLEKFSDIPLCPAVGQLGGHAHHSENRLKDFEYLTVERDTKSATQPLIVTGSSDGSIGVWTVDLPIKLDHLQPPNGVVNDPNATTSHGKDLSAADDIPYIGRLLGKYETGNRITCLKAFVMVEVSDKENESHRPTNENSDVSAGGEVTSGDTSA